PSLEPLQLRLDAVERGDVGGEFVDALPANAIPRAEPDPLQRIQHVELGHRQIRQTVDADRIPNDDGVEPPAAAWPSRRGAVFVAELPDAIPQFFVELCRERAVAD